ncbi:HlyC/CorC family transporter [Oceanobacillus zhaokaii]|uniref:HlyC/CorC family transporter n=1 Tax=Oceanobacillus zhaokaii TaxID=2052660 RepID=A0A345PDH5_9BACI|nr:hemolysin family protein [Oceanobacillus zhaokaii]AXI08055.1 HlyC/CorC family transporter [Oceanobacillus zhaokaii]
MTIAIITLIVLILINAFFAASEMALVGMNDTKVQKMAENGDKKAIMIYNLTSEPSRFLSTIQIGITLAGFLSSAFAADFFAGPLATGLANIGIPLELDVLNTISVVVITLVLSYFTLVFGELVPKQIAIQKTEKIANSVAKPLTFLFKIFLPLVKLLTFSTNTVVRMFGIDPNAHSEEATEEEIRMLVDVGGERGTINVAEKLMINNIFEFNDKNVSDIITHRTDMSVLSIEATLKETVEMVNELKYTRFPIFEGDIDNIIGILHVKDLLPYVDRDYDNSFNLKKIIRKPYFVLETQTIDILFADMQKNNAHIAIVLDEYGGTEGLVTIEDVIEEIVGEIFSESDGPEEEEIIQIAPNQYSIEGVAHLYELQDIIDIEFPIEDFDTVSGFLIGEIGYIPTKEERPVITYKNLVFEVTEVAENRIEKIVLTIDGDVGESNQNEEIEGSKESFNIRPNA